MKARICSRLILPGALLLLVLFLACQQPDEDSTPPTAPTLPAAGQTAKPLTASEREAIADFSTQYEALEQEWVELRAAFDGWRSGLTECHPSAAQEALSQFAASFKEVTEAARNLPRTTTTKELADLIIPSVEAEETALRTLRDRWLPGNASFFETVEQRRTEASEAQQATEDRSLELQEQFEAGPTAAEVEEAKQFSLAFKQIEDEWGNYHDEYRILRNKEANLEVEDVVSSYEELAENFSVIVESVAELEATEVLQGLIERLDGAADDELDALGALIEALEDGYAKPAPPPQDPMMDEQEEPMAAMAGEATAPTEQAPGEGAPVAGQGQAPSAGEGQAPRTGLTPGIVAGSQIRTVAGDTPSDDLNEQVQDNGEPSIFHLELHDAYGASIAVLDEVSQGIDEIVEDKSAEHLVDVMDFNSAYEKLLVKWESFHEEYDDWRSFGGGCERIAVLEDLDEFSASASSLAAKVRALPRTGYLLPAYTLVVDAAEGEAQAMRALYNSWRPFAIDAFAAVEQERTNADRLRQQAMTGLQELTARP